MPRAKANRPIRRAHACCGPLKARASQVAKIGTRGRAGWCGARRHIVRPPRARTPPPRARLDARAHLRVELSAIPQIRYAQGAVGVRAPVARPLGRIEPRFVAPGHPTVLNRCPAKICPISPSQFLASTRGVARLRAGACIEVRGGSAPGARVVGVGRARFAVRRVAQGTNTRPRPPAPPHGPNSHPPPRRATHVQRARAD